MVANDHGQSAPAPRQSASADAAAPARRVSDAPILLFGAYPGASGIAADLSTFVPEPELLANAAFLVQLGSGDALVVPAADAHLLPRGQGGDELKARAAALTQALRRERDWVRRRLAMPDHLLAYADRLQQASREADVYEAIREFAIPVVGAFSAIVYVGVATGELASFHPLADRAFRLEPLPPHTVQLFTDQRLVTDTELEAHPDGPLAPLAAVLRATAATQLLCAPIADDAVLALAERRRHRVFTGEDRDLLQALVRQAEAALHRVRSQRLVARGTYPTSAPSS